MARTVFTVILALVLIAGISYLGARALVEYRLTPEQKFELRHETGPIKSNILKQLESSPEDGTALAELIEILVLEGNLGRADLLSRVHGVRSENLISVRKLFAEIDAEAKTGKLENRRRDERWMRYVDWPIYGNFRFSQGYRYAVLGDWVSAKNEFDAIKNKKSGIKINPLLADHLGYMLARCNQESGDHNAAIKMLEPMLDSNKANGLRPKIYSSLIASYLSLGDERRAENMSKRLDFVSGFTWEKTKAHLSWGDFYIANGRKTEALDAYVKALDSDETSATLATSALEGILNILSSRDASLELKLDDVMLIADAAARTKKTAEAKRAIDWILDSKPDSKLLPEFLLAKVYLSLDADDKRAAESAMSSLNLIGASDDVMARALYYFGAYYAKKKDNLKADEYYLSSSKLVADISADARFRRYLLMKQNKAKNKYNIEAAKEDLKFIVDNFPESRHFADAAEELIAIYFYKGETAAAKKLAESLTGKGTAAENLKNYWFYRIAQKNGDASAAEAAKSALKWRSYTYFEVAIADSPALQAVPSKSFALEPERVDEVFFGMGLFDLGRESAINAEWLIPDISLAEEAFSRLDYGTFEAAAWHAEKLVEKGIIADNELLHLLLDMAYPRPFEDEVRAAAARHGLNPAIIWAIMKQESGFKPVAVSSAGAAGLMQLMPDTASWLIGGGKAQNLGDFRTSPAANIELGAAYIAYLKNERMAGQPLEALLGSYNAGPGNTLAWMSRYPDVPGWLYAELIPNLENERFTKRVMRNYDIYIKLERK